MKSQITQLTDVEKNHILCFIRAFIPKRRRQRWKVVFEDTSDKWSRLSMDDLWEQVGESGSVNEIDIDKTMSNCVLIKNHDAIMFRLSMKPHVVHGTVIQLVDLGFDDAIISIDPGRLVLASHHGGGWVRCES